ncbi:MAG: BamA/TamA family outer membrane protein [Flavobacteriales bacterium]|nr:BamA/TamA family outer membrane protein [Flavobacteriales bacterium]
MKRLYRIMLLALFFLNTASAVAQSRVRLIIEQKEESIKPSKLNRLGGLKEFYADSMTALTALQGLMTALHENGYSEAGVDEQTWKKDTVIAKLHIGKPYSFGTIDHGNVPEDVLRKVGFRDNQFEDASMSGKRLNGLKKRIIRFYENRGYPFTHVELDSITLQGNQLSAKLNMDKHQQFIIDSIIIKGTARVVPKYLQNYLGIRPKSVYNESRIRPISTRVKEIAFVNETKSPEVVFKNGKADIYMYLDKKRASQFDGILGVLPSSEKPGSVLITGQLTIKLLSAFKRGELIDLSWKKTQPRTQNLNIHLAYPFLFNTGFGVDGTFQLYKRDSLYLNLQGVAGLQYHLIGNDYIKVFADIRSTNVLAPSTLTSTTTLNPDNVDSKTQLYGFGYKMQRLDYRLNPRKGFDLYAEASAGAKKIIPDATVEISRYDGLKLSSFQLSAVLQASYFVPIPNRSTIMIKVNGGYMRSQNLFESEAFRIGGLKTLRGFDEEAIYATMFSIGTIEYRFLLDQNSYLFAFFDGAYYENRATNKRITDRPFGFGLGISFFTKIGVFSLNYALGKQFKNPIDFRAGKIHFGIVSYF